MYTNLVFSGGGLKGTYYIGVLKYMYERGTLDRVRNVIGSSVGSVFGMVSCIKTCNYKTLMTQLDKVTAQVRDTDVPAAINNVLDIYNTWGLTDADGFMEVVGDYLEETLGARDITFLEFAKHTGKNFIVVGSNLTKRRVEYFSMDTTPRMSVATAIRISISVPLVFKPVKHEDSIYVDASIYNHAPFDYFDSTNKCEKTLAIEVLDDLEKEDRLPCNLSEYLNHLVDAIHEQLNKKTLPDTVRRVVIRHKGSPASPCLTDNFVMQDVGACVDIGYDAMLEEAI